MEKKIFLAIGNLDLDGSLECNDIIATHSTTEEAISKLDYSLTLVFENESLAKVVSNSKKKQKEIPFNEGFKNIKYPNTLYYPLNMRLTNNKTQSYLGGYKPSQLTMPNHGLVSFQYLGFLSKSEPIFKGEGWDIDLIFPLYSNVQKVFIDYSNPMKPNVLNVEELENATTSHGEYINGRTQIDFLKQEIEFYKPEKNKKRGVFASSSLAGIPNWLQNPYIPHCPKSGNRMNFLMQIGDQTAYATPIRYSNIKLLGLEAIETVDENGKIDVYYQKPFKETYYERMNFWGAGTLYIFFEPETKVICYFVQNT